MYIVVKGDKVAFDMLFRVFTLYLVVKLSLFRHYW